MMLTPAEAHTPDAGPEEDDAPDVALVEIHATAGGDGAAVRTFTLHLRDGRVLVAPVDWYPRLARATLDELSVVETWGDVVEWPLVNEVVPVRFVLDGVRGSESETSLAEWQALMERRRAQIARGDEPEPHYPTLPLPDWWEDDDAPDGRGTPEPSGPVSAPSLPRKGR